MKVKETGVLPESEVYFHTPSVSSRELFLTLLCAGKYDCSAEYLVRLSGYGSGLMLTVLSGGGFAEIGGRRVSLRRGDSLLLDCYVPHCYGTDTGWRILWLHFDGALARRMLGAVGDARRVLRQGRRSYDMRVGLEEVYSMFSGGGGPPEDARIHAEITRMLSFFFQGGEGGRENRAVDTAAAMLSDRLSERLTSGELARAVHMSESQLNRLFRREKGMSPHRYRIEARLNAARYLLVNTDLPLRDIAEQCGFRDASALANQFRLKTGLTPRRYAGAAEEG